MTNTKSKWTHFWDMHSGGSQKLKWGHIFIEAGEKEAEIIFQNRFGQNPHRVTCTCCGEDYSVSEEDSLEQATAFHRNCGFDEKKKIWIEEQDRQHMEIRESCNTPKKDKWGLYIPLKEYLKSKELPSRNFASASIPGE